MNRNAPPSINIHPTGFPTMILFLAAAFLSVSATPLRAEADLSVTVVASPNPVGAGSNLIYSVTVSNAGPMTATDVILTNKLSPGQSVVGGGFSTCPDPGPVAWWKAEGNGNDASGTNDLALAGDASFVAGRVGLGLSFDGAGDYARALDSPQLRPASFTIEGWFRPARVAGTQVLVSKPFGTRIFNSFAIYLEGSTLRALISDGRVFDILIGPALAVDTWYHIAYAWDEGTTTHKLYVDGMERATHSSPATKQVPYDSNSLLIGAENEGSGPTLFYAGLADEITLFDYALSPGQIEEIFLAASAGKCSASTVFALGDLDSMAAISVTLEVTITQCHGIVTNVAFVTTTANDVQVNNNQANSTVAILDPVAPEISCVPDKSVGCEIAWDFDLPSATDNCTLPTVTIVGTTTNSAGLCGGTFAATRTWRASDESGNVAECSQTVTVTDTTPPSITCAPDKTVSGGGAWTFDPPTMASDSCGDVVVTVLSTVTNDVQGAEFAVVRTCEARDGCENISLTCSQTVTVMGTLAIPGLDLALWLRGDQGVVTNGPTVLRWNDQSGNERHAAQASSANQPVLVPRALNGLPALRFDGLDDFLTFNLPVNGLEGMTILLVAANTQDQRAGSTQAERAAVFWNETRSWGTVYVSPFQDGVNFRFGTTQVGNRQFYPRPVSAGSAYTLTTVIKDRTTDTLRVDGAEVLRAAGKRPAIAGIRDIGNLARGHNDDTFYGGEIAEVIVYTRALSAEELQFVEQYLRGKYSLSVSGSGLLASGGGVIGDEYRVTLQAEAQAGSLRIMFSGLPGTSYILERSSDLREWTPVKAITLPMDGPGFWTEMISVEEMDESTGYFRARLE